jgi:hypothetical protein
MNIQIFKNRYFLLLAFFMLISCVIIAQPQPPEGNAGEEGPMGGPAPITGDLSLLLFAFFYIIRKICISSTLLKQLFRFNGV